MKDMGRDSDHVLSRRNGRIPRTVKGSLKKIKYCKVSKGEHDFMEFKRYTSYRWCDTRGHVSSGQKPKGVEIYHISHLVIMRCKGCGKKDYYTLTEG